MFDNFDNLLFDFLWLISIIYFSIWFIYISFIKKQPITVLSTTIIMNIFIPLFLMYPFSKSPNNIDATGVNAYTQYSGHINEVFFISFIGTTSFIIGTFFARRYKYNFDFLNKMNKSITFLSKKSILNINLIFLLLISAIMYKLGFFSSFNGGRGFAMENPSLRPIANFFYSILPIFVILSLFRFYNKHSLYNLFLVLFGVMLSFTSGTRSSALVGILIFVYSYFNLKSNKRIRILRIITTALIFLVLAIYIGDIRNGQFNIVTSLNRAFYNIFYGNNFSDLRDFAWVYSGWDHHYFFGKTQLSGIMSFIPSSHSSFRDFYDLGSVTTRLIGYSNAVHPGLRPGIFGEAYLNFGYAGVVFFGFLYGFLIYRIHLFAQNALVIKNKSDALIRLLTSYIIANITLNIMITAGFFSLYIQFILLIIGYLLYSVNVNFNNSVFLKRKIV